MFIGVAVKKLENGAFTFAEQAVDIQRPIFSGWSEFKIPAFCYLYPILTPYDYD